MRKYLPYFLTGVVAAITVMMFQIGPALAGSIKTWVSGETVNAADLNANFSHIHNTMVGGHGARLVNADVSASAGISHSKLATPALLPKAWAYVASCTTGTCTMAASSGVTSVIAGVTDGTYTVSFPARTNTSYGVLITPVGVVDMVCWAEPIIATTEFSFDCETHGVAATDTGFTVMILDDN